MAKTKTMYMHTLDGEPAAFSKLWQIVHRVPHRSATLAVSLAEDLGQIDRERRASRKSAKRDGIQQGKFGHVRVEVPNVR